MNQTRKIRFLDRDWDANNRNLSKYWVVAYILILGANLVIRFMGLPGESLYGDEVFSVFFAQQPLANLHEKLLYDRNPPFYFTILHFWIILFGYNAVVLKGLSALFTTGTAYFLIKLSTKHFNKTTALIVSILFILSNIWLRASHELRSFSLVGLLSVISFYYYLNTLKEDRISNPVLLAVSNLLLLFTHYIAVYVTFVQFLCSFLFLRENKKRFLTYIYSQAIALILYLPWLKIVIENIPDSRTFWLAIPDLPALKTVFTNLSGNTQIWYIHLSIVGFFVLLYFIDKKKRFISPEFNAKLAIVLLLWYLLPILANYAVAQITPVFRLMYLLYASFGLMLLIGYIISVFKIHPVLKTILIVALFYPSFQLFSIKQHVLEDWKTNVREIVDLKDDKTVVLICDWPMHRNFAYYYDLEIFKDYHHTTDRLRFQYIHAIGDSIGLKTIPYKWADKIIYVRSHDIAGDPKNTIEALLNQDYSLCKRFGQDLLHVEIYLKNSIPCDSLIPIEVFPKEKCSLWEKKLVRTLYNDQFIRYFNDMEASSDCEATRNLINTTVFSEKYAAIVIDSMEYSPALILPFHEIDTINQIDISVMVFMEYLNNASIVCSINNPKRSLFWTSYDLKNSVQHLNAWVKVKTTIFLPDIRDHNSELRIFLWNPNPEPVYIDNFEICF